MTLSALVYVVLVLIIVGIVLRLINLYVPMAGIIKTILNLVVVIAVILWLLAFFGIIDLHSLANMRIK